MEQDVNSSNPYSIQSQYAAAGTPVKEAQPLQRALNEHGAQLDELSGLLSQLQERLQPLKRDSIGDTSPNKTEPAEPQRSSSFIVTQVSEQTGIVKNLQYRIGSLLEELEV